MTPLHVRTAGEGPPLLLIHGAAEDAAMLTPQAEAFAARGRRVDLVRPPRHRRQHPGRLAGRRRRPARRRRRRPAARPRRRAGHRARLQLRRGGRARPGRPPPRAGHRGHRLGAGRGGHAARRGRAARPADGPIEAHLAAHPADWSGAYAVMLRRALRRPGRPRVAGGPAAAASTPRPPCATTPASSPPTSSARASCPRSGSPSRWAGAPARCTRASPRRSRPGSDGLR